MAIDFSKLGKQKDNEKEDYGVQGWVDLYESNPEYKSIMYGNITIPLDLIQEALEAEETKEVKGMDCVVLSVQLYPFEREWNFDTEPPIASGYVKRKQQKQRNGNGRNFKTKTTGQRRRF